MRVDRHENAIRVSYEVTAPLVLDCSFSNVAVADGISDFLPQ